DVCSSDLIRHAVRLAAPGDRDDGETRPARDTEMEGSPARRGDVDETGTLERAHQDLPPLGGGLHVLASQAPLPHAEVDLEHRAPGPGAEEMTHLVVEPERPGLVDCEHRHVGRL